MEVIYVLKLEGDRWYVGKTHNVEKRFNEHLCGKGSAWTSKFKPLEVYETLKITSPFDEDKVTKEYMLKYGIDKVRGGAYSTSELDSNTLIMQIRHAKNLCMRCGRAGHFITSCYAKTDSDGNPFVKILQCKRCGREGHENDTCKYKTTVDRKKIVCKRCGRNSHVESECYAGTNKYGNLL